MITIDRQPVKSSNVRSIGYDAASRTLHVEFNSQDARMPGRVYEYKELPQEDYAELMAAPSIGKHFAQRIKSRFSGAMIKQ